MDARYDVSPCPPQRHPAPHHLRRDAGYACFRATFFADAFFGAAAFLATGFFATAFFDAAAFLAAGFFAGAYFDAAAFLATGFFAAAFFAKTAFFRGPLAWRHPLVIRLSLGLTGSKAEMPLCGTCSMNRPPPEAGQRRR